jgi:fructose-specific phosphotransferase system IIC component
MPKRTIIAISVGLLFYFIIRYAAETVMQHIAPLGRVSYGVVASTFLGMLIELSPGFIAGWISGSRGLLAGFVVGLLGSGCYSAVAGTAAHYFQASEAQSLVMESWFFTMCIVVGFFSAAAGGSAQLLRSNKSFKADGSAAA